MGASSCGPGESLVYERYDRLPQVDTAAIVKNKRLSHALQAALAIQAQRDDRRKSNTPSRTNQGQAPYSTKALPGTKRSRQFTSQDLDETVRAVCRAPKKNNRVGLRLKGLYNHLTLDVVQLAEELQRLLALAILEIRLKSFSGSTGSLR
ncbi:hypothetical protein LJR175_008062 [Variovorax sp. LjRoot175]|uniref:hypothetical protein n=1 Tax=Variovorax sp. LjRoot175 TaxID=3342276 RepID=UPI003ECEE1FC